MFCVPVAIVALEALRQQVGVAVVRAVRMLRASTEQTALAAVRAALVTAGRQAAEREVHLVALVLLARTGRLQ